MVLELKVSTIEDIAYVFSKFGYSVNFGTSETPYKLVSIEHCTKLVMYGEKEVLMSLIIWQNEEGHKVSEILQHEFDELDRHSGKCETMGKVRKKLVADFNSGISVGKYLSQAKLKGLIESKPETTVPVKIFYNS